MLANRIRLPIGIGIAATTLALVVSTYGLLQKQSFIQQPEPFFYKTIASVPNVPDGLFIYGGATAFAPLRSASILWKLTEAQPHFQLVYTEAASQKQGSGTEIKRLINGEISFAESSRPLQESELEAARKRGLALKQIPIAIDGIAFYVNPQLPLSGLSLSQVKEIFTGNLVNWKEIGGPNLPITPFSLAPQRSGTAAVLAQVLAGEAFGQLQIVKNTTNSIREVAQTPGGIGYATASLVVDQETVKPLALSKMGEASVSPVAGSDTTKVNVAAFTDGSYPLTRKLYIIVKEDGSVDEQAGIAYANLLLSDEGQRLLEQVGFSPIRID